MSATIAITVAPHWINAWFLRLAARPVVRVDGAELPTAWGRRVTAEVGAGTCEVAAGVRYKGFMSVLGADPKTVAVRDNETVELLARNGVLNSTPFTFRSVVRTSAGAAAAKLDRPST